MVFFIVVLRALAACLITNSHYTGIYPTDMIANGGLIGDILFFAVSGYCLFHVKKSFPRWYGRRLARVYTPVFLITAIYCVLGCYTFSEGQNFLWWFLYPTGYHFVGSIVLLYIPFWFVGRFEWLRNRLGSIMAFVAVVYVGIYCIFYDKSYYHIDNVREWMIKFLFFESMLLGAWFKKNQEKFHNKFYWWVPTATVVAFVVYFASKLFFSKYSAYSSFQIVNQVFIFAVLFFSFWLFASLDGKLAKLPKAVKAPISFIAGMTLEIYVVQSVLIDFLRPHFGFPLNWLVITASILLAAFALHLACKYLMRGIEWCFDKAKSALTKRKA